MEVVAAAPGGGGVPPFHDHDVREWSRIDSITGALERARLETDSWTANTNNSRHKYGKVVDSRARTGADGAVHQQARRQLEVFQSQIPGGHLQVIKTHTVSSSRWSSSSTTANGIVTGSRISGGATQQTADAFSRGFEDLKLSVNHLDLTSEKSKASVGRSVSRRPPSRHPRLRDIPQPSQSSTDTTTPLRSPHFTAATNLHRVSRLCHQIHENAVRQAFGGKRSPPISERENGDGSASGVEICEIESSATSSSESKSLNGHTNLTRTKSTSSDDIHQVPDKDFAGKGVEDLEDLEQLQNWRRTSKIRRSLQFPKHNRATNSSVAPKPIDLPENSVNVRKIREDLEKGRRLNTALRNNSVDLEALDQILQSISSSSSVDKTSTDDNLDDLENDQLISKPKRKRDSFVTVESLKEVRGRLRKTSSPTHDIYKSNNGDEADDGIVTEDTEKSNVPNRVRSYVYGMEAMINKKPTVLGTGSLESRSKLVNGNNSNRNEDWYNRRKSYGFEQVHGHEEATNSISLKNKNVVESSTDSGICRSSEIVLVPTATKTNNNHNNNNNNNNRFDERSDSESETYNGYDKKITNGINYGNVKRMTNIFNQDEKTTYYNKNQQDEFGKPWIKQRASLSDADWRANELKSTTITIPIVKNNNVVDLSWNDEPEKDIKRHSIAVDESKYVTKQNDNQLRRTSLVANDFFSKTDALDDDNGFNNRKKRVEFCKTEVHFAADSGKVNIVETDEKPPPTQNFRRRRRNSGPTTNFNEDFNKNGMPILHFGDSEFEKTMFGIAGDDTDINNKLTKENNISDPETHHNNPSVFGMVTVNTSTNNTNTNQTIDYQEDDKREWNYENDNIKGILKNKPIKPKPYHLGETIPFSDTNSDEESKKWGVKLKPVLNNDNKNTTSTPVWKSTVTVHNSYYDKPDSKKEPVCDKPSDGQPEFQKLLRNLRPTKRTDYMSDNENRYSDSFSNIRIVTPVKDIRRSSWSVADRVRLTDDGQMGMESKGYSTKVNFGDGEAIVVENETDNNSNGQTTWPRSENLSNDTTERLKPVTTIPVEAKNNSAFKQFEINSNRNKLSPVLLRKSLPTTNTMTELKTTSTMTPEKLSSPSLVGRNSYRNNFESPTRLSATTVGSGRVSPSKGRKSPSRSRSKSPTKTGRDSPVKEIKTVTDNMLQTNMVLRQPKKSEMTYFGVNVSPKPAKKISQAVIKREISKLSEKPDLLHHHQNKQRTPSPNRKTKPRKSSPKTSPSRDQSPIYENIHKTKNKETNKAKRYGITREFDSSILDELTKAADQILQAVNGYTDEDCHNRLSSDEDTKNKIEPLETISETKSYRHAQHHEAHTKASKAKVTTNVKSRVRRTSSNSSVESLSKDRRKVASSVSVDRSKAVTNIRKVASSENLKKKLSNDSNNSSKANTKARRLQRASSREALLQSHGSSSEDLAVNVEVPVRKPRLVKKTKAAQFTITNGLEFKKPTARRKEEVASSKPDERILHSLPEIRHKTAVSTIRSTAEKSSRDRSKQRNEELKSKMPNKKEVSKSSGAPTPSLRATPRNSRTTASSTTNLKETVTHRISTANIKKCHRSEGVTRHKE